ncbi:MAG: type IV pilin N-terminal domain-containing protein [Methanoregula sp.]|jgi:flagellin-like protein
MAFTKKNDEAVSPVIGVILMVAITVILAAVIAAFVFGMAGNVSKTKVVSVTAQRAGNSVALTNMGGQDVGSVTSFSVSIAGADPTALTTMTKTVGSTEKVTAATNPSRVIVTGLFNDGTTQVLLDTNL